MKNNENEMENAAEQAFWDFDAARRRGCQSPRHAIAHRLPRQDPTHRLHLPKGGIPQGRRTRRTGARVGLTAMPRARCQFPGHAQAPLAAGPIGLTQHR